MRRSHCMVKSLKLFLCVLLLLSAGVSAYAEVPVDFIGNRLYATSGFDAERIKNVVKSAFQLGKNEQQLHRVTVSVRFADTDLPDHLIVHLLDKDTYSFETARVNLRNGYKVKSIQRNYTETEEEDRLYATYGTCPDSSVDMVFGTNLTGGDYPTAVKAINYAADLATSLGYKVKTLWGKEENRAAYYNWLACSNVRMVGRVGHGNQRAIYVDDGIVDYTYFRNLGSSGLANKVFNFNSCLTHNYPLEPAIVGAGIQKYIGGKRSLYVGQSEEVFKCWLNSVLTQGQSMSSALTACERKHYAYTGAFGISGNGSDYFTDSGSNNDNGGNDGSCQEFTATNSQHVSAGRAYTQNVQNGCNMETHYYAAGSNTDLGTSGSTTTTLYTQNGSTYYVGACSGGDSGGDPVIPGCN